jgi:hypothetical protein
MIDTDKYEGHTPAPWDGILSGYFTIEQLKTVDKTLMQDAPLLLAEVKRLRGMNYLDLDLKYFEEYEEEVAGKEWEYTRNKLGNLAYEALYRTARELGMSIEQARLFCTSKFVRHYEDHHLQTMTEAFLKAWSDDEESTQAHNGKTWAIPSMKKTLLSYTPEADEI